MTSAGTLGIAGSVRPTVDSRLESMKSQEGWSQIVIGICRRVAHGLRVRSLLGQMTGIDLHTYISKLPGEVRSFTPPLPGFGECSSGSVLGEWV